jgi:glutamate-1-semialdehyde-2,1-aminomutase
MKKDNLVDLLELRAQKNPDFPIYRYLQDGEQASEPVTYSELAISSKAIAGYLQQKCAECDRVMLLFPPGVEFIEAFMGCLYSRRIGVALPPPRISRIVQTLEKMQAIASSAAPKIVLTTREIVEKAEEHFAAMPELKNYLWVPIDTAKSMAPENFNRVKINSQDIAYLQYTSGSTSLPKGVILTHSNLMHNMHYFDLSGLHFKDSRLLTWLPAFHDLGLIYGLLMPILTETQTFIMSNAAFIQRPSRWLEAISQYRITHTMGPNFSFDFSMRGITPEQKAALDLSSWQYALNGAEPVRMEVMQRFSKCFANNGFNIKVFSPSWGLAEASCIVTGSHYLGENKPKQLLLDDRRSPVEIFVDATGLCENKITILNCSDKNAVSLAGSGFPIADTIIKIVNPLTLEECLPNQIGELWVNSKSVSPGYWERPEESAHTFNVAIKDGHDDRRYMRTGDLGFLFKNEVYITGRIKDVLIIRGQNFYPQDIEWVVEQSHPLLRVGGSAAFSIVVENEERLVIVVEIGRRFNKDKDAEPIFSNIRQVISGRFDLQTEAIALIRMGSIPKTTSGKIQRKGTREQFLEGQLNLQAQWVRERASKPSIQHPALALLSWLRLKLAEYSGMAPEYISDDATFGSLGMDSSQSVRLIGELEQAFSLRDLPATLAYDFPSITQLAGRINALVSNVDKLNSFSPKSAIQAIAIQAIAIVGMSCRFPGSNNIKEFEKMLWAGTTAITSVSDSRRALLDNLVPDPHALGHAGFIERIEFFDPAFFNISAREAEQMDPQQRLILQLVWHALEDAGLTFDMLAESNTGVFVGISHSDYAAITRGLKADKGIYSGTGSATSIAANRISYFLNLKGPSIAIDTACSSSLVALHHARQSIIAGECETAIVVGSNLIMDPTLSQTLKDAGMISPTNACHSFSADADGYVRGEGIGVVILQNQTALIAHSATARALILGSAINQDGRSFGLTAPNGISQAKVLGAAVRNAGIDPAKLMYVEAHGTGTSLGDPIETSAIENVYGVAGRVKPCLIGSVKANIGHLEAAAGIAGLIKAVLCLQKNSVPFQPDIKQLNPHLKFDSRNIDICRTHEQQQLVQPLEHVAVTSMGFGGTNAHIILQAIKTSGMPEGINGLPRAVSVLPVSAKSTHSLAELCVAYADQLERPEQSLAALISAAATRRTHFNCRIAITGGDKTQVIKELRIAAEKCKQTAISQFENKRGLKVAFVFSGQGSQFSQMAKDLYDTSRLFKTILDNADAFLQANYNYKLLDNLYGKNCLDEATLAETQHTQVCVFVVEYALAQLLKHWGVHPDVLIGHSLGELVAATFAEVMSLEAALGLVYERAQLMNQCSAKGAMLAITASQDRVVELLNNFGNSLSIAAINCATQVTVSGEVNAIAELQLVCKQQKIPTFRLPVSHAFHSVLMNSAAQDILVCAERLEYTKPNCLIIGNLTGKEIQDFNPTHWRDHLLSCVQFEKSITRAHELGVNTFIEVCAKPVLSAQIKQVIPSDSECFHSSLFEEGGAIALSCIVAYLYKQGVKLNWNSIYEDSFIPEHLLPLYPFDEKVYWPAPGKADNNFALTVDAGTSKIQISKAAEQVKMSPSEIGENLKLLLAPLLRTTSADINEAKSFLEMGADSLVLVEFVRQITMHYQVELAMPMLFEELAYLPELIVWIMQHGVTEATTKPEQIIDADIKSGAEVQAGNEFIDDEIVSSKDQDSIKDLLSIQLDAFNKLAAHQLSAIGSILGKTALNNSSASLVPAPVKKPTVPLSSAASTKVSTYTNVLTGSGSSSNLNELQKKHLSELISKYEFKTSESKKYAETYRNVFSDYRSSLGFRLTTKELIYPLVVESAKGSKIVDLNGNVYIDLTMAFGSSLMGYNPDFIVDAMVKQISGNGIQVGPKSPLTGKAASLISELTGNARVAFANSGTEAVMTAIRLARAVSGRTKIARFSGAYHGHADVTLVKKGLDSHIGFPVAPGVPASVAADTLVLDFVSDESLNVIRENLNELAAIVVEPIQSRRPGVQSAAFLQQLRELANEAGCALIFDEIITGFRLAQGGAQEYFGVKADLVAYGKVAGGGMPLGVIAGNSKYMDAIDGGVWHYGDETKPKAGATFFAGTFSGHPATMSACIAILEKLKEQQGRIQESINTKTRQLVENINQYFRDHGFPINVDRAGSLFRFVFFNNFSVEFQPIEANIFFYNMTLRGVYIWEGHTCFISDAHTDDDLTGIFQAVKDSSQAMRLGGFFLETKKSNNNAQALAHLDGQAASYIAFYFSQTLGELAAGDSFTLSDFLNRAEVQPKYFPLVKRFLEILVSYGLVRIEGEDITLLKPINTLANQVPFFDHTPISVHKLLRHCATKLSDVLRGKLSATDVLFSGEGFQWVESLYLDAPGCIEAISTLCKLVKKAANLKSGQIRILEVGGGTGSATKELVASLRDTNYQYTFTDVSSAFLNKATQLFGNNPDFHYSIFDIERDALLQGFEAAGFDVIVASNVVHATEDLQFTLTNLRRLLSPSGQLVLLECVEKKAWMDVIFGLTDGWWRGVNCNLRQAYPLMSASNWDTTLTALGYTGVAIDCNSSGQAVICGTPLPEPDANLVPGKNTSLALSDLQREILVHMDMAEDLKMAYSESALFDLKGELDEKVLTQAWEQIINRHESLQVKVSPESQAFQYHHLASTLAIVDFSFLDNAIGRNKVSQWIKNQLEIPFSIESGPLIKATLLKLAGNNNMLFILGHHLIIDGVSYGILITELLDSYRMIRTQEVVSLPEAMKLGAISAPIGNPKAKAYWINEFSQGVPYLALPIDSPFMEQQTFNAGRTSLRLTSELSQAIQGFSRNQGVTPFMTLLAGYRILLHKLCNQTESIIGVPVSLHPADANKIFLGYGVNLLPLRQVITNTENFSNLVGATRKKFFNALEHKSWPFSELVKTINPIRNPSRPAVITVLFNYEKISSLSAANIECTPVVPPASYSKYELTLDVVFNGDFFELVLTWNKDLFHDHSAQTLLLRMENLLSDLLAQPERPLGDLTLLLPAEQRNFILQGEAISPEPKCLHQLFEDQVSINSNACALRSEDLVLTYAELNQQANQIAHFLLSLGVSRNDRVAVCLERTPQLIATLLAILKCGAAYVPLDPKYPRERLNAILADASAAFIIVDDELYYPDWNNSAATPVIGAVQNNTQISLQKKTNPDIDCATTDLAYLIYTSGSTGVPKGVAIEHHSVHAMLSWAQKEFSHKQLQGVVASTSICFDLSVYEIFLPISCGTKIILLENILYLPELAKQDDITLINTVPSAIEELVKQDALPAHLAVINLAGEALSLATVKRIRARAPELLIYNLYGPSEDTTYTTWLRISPDHDREVTIGFPIAGTQIYLLDDQLNPVPEGVAGTIYVAGKGLSRGYWNNPLATASCFLPNPFCAEAGNRMYCTGDLGKLNEKGEIVFLGRKDHQVKVRGHRIELGEIETAIESIDNVQKSVVLAIGESGKQYLVAFYTTVNTFSLDESAIHAVLTKRLPSYMVPAHIYFLDTVPLTPNGKTNRKALENIICAGNSSAAGRRILRDELVEQIELLWNSYLQKKDFELTDDFFVLGGHSLMATQIIFDVNKKFGLKLKLSDLMKAPTVLDFSSKVRNAMAALITTSETEGA